MPKFLSCKTLKVVTIVCGIIVCGKRNDFGRIVGGTTAMKHEFPWLGAVVFKGPGFGRQPFCGGSLINNRYFLSAVRFLIFSRTI